MFQLNPRIYSLLLCDTLKEDPRTGGWIVQPFSEVSVQQVPLHLRLTLLAQIMAPPGTYELGLRMFHTADPENTVQVLAPRKLTVLEGKNMDFVLNLEARITRVGLHVIEAAILNHHTTFTPLRITPQVEA
jgi:hypothetical protein